MPSTRPSACPTSSDDCWGKVLSPPRSSRSSPRNSIPRSGKTPRSSSGWSFPRWRSCWCAWWSWGSSSRRRSPNSSPGGSRPPPTSSTSRSNSHVCCSRSSCSSRWQPSPPAPSTPWAGSSFRPWRPPCCPWRRSHSSCS